MIVPNLDPTRPCFFRVSADLYGSSPVAFYGLLFHISFFPSYIFLNIEGYASHSFHVNSGMLLIYSSLAPIPIRTCQTLSSSGVYYLTEDIEVTHSSPNCIEITSPSVVLDGHNYAIIGEKRIPGEETQLGMLMICKLHQCDNVLYNYRMHYIQQT